MIYLGSDHGGFRLKEKIKDFLVKRGYEFDDLGNSEFDAKDDYPDFAFAVGEKVKEHEDNKGILLCRSSGGMVIAANKVKGIRAVSVHDVKAAKHAVEHDNANIIALAGDWINEKDMLDIVEAFLTTNFKKEKRHVRRLKKISDYEKK
jgi:ribose 5-phosphate isomerase B